MTEIWAQAAFGLGQALLASMIFIWLSFSEGERTKCQKLAAPAALWLAIFTRTF